MKYSLPVRYDELEYWQRKEVRLQYIDQQGGLCMYCGKSLDGPPCEDVTKKPVNWKLFPDNFLKHPIHLQHCHKTGMTEGVVHAYCNAVLWQYHGR